jgi:hypothetical protein
MKRIVAWAAISEQLCSRSVQRVWVGFSAASTPARTTIPRNFQLRESVYVDGMVCYFPVLHGSRLSEGSCYSNIIRPHFRQDLPAWPWNSNAPLKGISRSIPGTVFMERRCKIYRPIVSSKELSWRVASEPFYGSYFSYQSVHPATFWGPEKWSMRSKSDASARSGAACELQRLPSKTLLLEQS